MTAWDINLELNVPSDATDKMVRELRDALADAFIPNALFTNEFSIDGLEWCIDGRVPYTTFNQVLDVINNAHRDFSFILCYNSDDLLSVGHALWAGGKLIVNELRENLTYDEYRACGLDADSWFNVYAHDEDDWQEIIDDADSSPLLLAELYEFLVDFFGLDEDDDEILQAIAEHPNYSNPQPA